jgi:uncharacterized protein YggL (DUF469 family)
MKISMTISAAVLAVVSATIISTAASAQSADDVKWINQCISDNKNEKGGTPQIVRAYCVCMNDKMDENETRSITQWEKANPKARVACEKQAGWK